MAARPATEITDATGAGRHRGQRVVADEQKLSLAGSSHFIPLNSCNHYRSARPIFDHQHG